MFKGLLRRLELILRAIVCQLIMLPRDLRLLRNYKKVMSKTRDLDERDYSVTIRIFAFFFSYHCKGLKDICEISF